ncbi:hypothetical protein HK102_010398 [Quaeritorhiza haematococci]|nr:hypothetical protein HK102_010398 [Quaeritorhiza haematococci]
MAPQITPDQIKAIIATAQVMKAKGSTEATDPEYAKLLNILRYYNQVAKQQHLQQQIQQQQQQHPHPQAQQQRPNQSTSTPVQPFTLTAAQPSTNPPTVAAGSPVPPSLPTSSQPPSNNRVNGVSSKGKGVAGAVPATANSIATSKGNSADSFTNEHLGPLVYQILAFKRLSANQAVPDHLRQKVFDPNPSFDDSDPELMTVLKSTVPPKIVETVCNLKKKGQSVFEKERHPFNQQNASVDGSGSADGSGAQQQLATTSSDAQTSDLQTYRMEPGVSDPYAALLKPVTVDAHAARQQRLLIPAVTPVGVDPFTMLAERERQLRARIEYRIKELENVPSNLSNQPVKIGGEAYSSASAQPNTNLKLKALIELKSLRLLEKQRKLRQDVLNALTKSTTLATAVDRTAYRRMKKQSLREARQTEKMERTQRLDREKKEYQKHIDYLNSIVIHGRELVAFHKTQTQRASKLGSQVLKWHTWAEKEEQKRLQRVSQERLRALKADDEEAYLKLIDQAKDTRITHLLQQTNSYLTSLTNAVVTQQREIGGGAVAVEEDDDQIDAGPKDYYQTAHRISEVITEQPSILVGGKLKEYQIKGLQWMVSLYNNKLNGILADEMGLGKTIQTISLVTYLMEKKKQNGPYLIIVPLSTITNWSLEFEKWAPSVSTIVYKGPPNERKRAAYEIRQGNFNVLLTTYEFIIKEKAILSKIKWIFMIIDEGHRMKNAQSKLSTTLMQFYYSRYRLILTGTPLQNNLPELWALLNFVLPKIFNSVKSFDEWFNSPFANAGGQDRIELNEEESLLVIRRLHKVLRPFLLRRLKKDVESELPDKVETVVKCKMSALQHRLYEQIKSKRTALAGGLKGLPKNATNNLMMQFRKICNHPFVFPEVENLMNPERSNDKILYRVAGKFELLDRVLPKFKATGHRVLMFFQMTAIMDIMEDFLRYKDYQYLRLDGNTKADERSELLKLFNAPNSPYFCFILSTRAGGLGLNLQTADTVIIFDSDWNPHQDLQAQDRAHRIGQTKEVRILRLVTSRSIEEVILEKARYKLSIDGKVIQAGKFDNKTSEAEREELLRKIFEEEDNDEEEEGELKDDELNEICARGDHELEIFKQLDLERQRQEREEWKAQGNKGDPPPRLMPDEELPEVYVQDPNEGTAQQVEEELGRGSRSRKSVRYDDGLNEEEWLDAIEEGNLDQAIEKQKVKDLKREERRRKKMAKMQTQEEEEEGGEEIEEEEEKKSSERGRRGRGASASASVVDEEEAAEVAATTGRKRGRKRALEEEPPAPEAILQPPRKKRKKKDPYGIDHDEVDPVPLATRLAMKRGFVACYTAVEEASVEFEGYKRLRCDLFRELPSKAMYPDYYQIIKKPIAMDFMQARMNSSFYKLPEQFKEDFHLMFANAMTYNVEGSDVYTDAQVMKNIFNETFEKMFPGGQPVVSPEDEAEAAKQKQQQEAEAAAAAAAAAKERRASTPPAPDTPVKDRRKSRKRGRSPGAGGDESDHEPSHKEKGKDKDKDRERKKKHKHKHSDKDKLQPLDDEDLETRHHHRDRDGGGGVDGEIPKLPKLPKIKIRTKEPGEVIEGSKEKDRERERDKERDRERKKEKKHRKRHSSEGAEDGEIEDGEISD